MLIHKLDADYNCVKTGTNDAGGRDGSFLPESGGRGDGTSSLPSEARQKSPAGFLGRGEAFRGTISVQSV
jgi:hypothetical protein